MGGYRWNEAEPEGDHAVRLDHQVTAVAVAVGAQQFEELVAQQKL